MGVQNARISYQRMHKVVGHALGRQPSHKLLLNFMKLYLHESFVSMKLLTQKKIEVFFKNVIGAKGTSKIEIMDWNEMSFKFS